MVNKKDMKVDIGSPEITQEVLPCKHRVLSPITRSMLLDNWDIAIVDLYRNGGMFVAYGVRLRNCSLHYNNDFNEYYIRYRDVTFGMYDVYNMR